MSAVSELTTKAGQVHPCEPEPDESHGLKSVHVVVRCECGAAFQSTDGTVALSMALSHAAAHVSRDLPSTRERPLRQGDNCPKCGGPIVPVNIPHDGRFVCLKNGHYL